MPPVSRAKTTTSPSYGVEHDLLVVPTATSLQFVDLTARVREFVRLSGVTDGVVNIQTRHTTTAIVVNENEPLLLEDLEDLLRRWAPSELHYRHDDLGIRTVNLTPGERSNGHAHARALVLGSSETLNIRSGTIRLGRWQRIFLVELDGPRERSVSVTAMGLVGSGRPADLRPARARRPAVA
jgi:secondary thiamine-phosphate synthase enzyme